jgi:hypothetical protein
MKKMHDRVSRLRASSSVSFFAVMTVLLLAFNCYTQDTTSKSIRKEIDVKVLSWEMKRFDKPIRLGVGKRAVEYREALVLKLQVPRDQFDSLPPDIEPFLYIGPEEYRMFKIERRADARELTLVFHIRNREKLREGWPIVLTIDHGAPIRDSKRFDKPSIPRVHLKEIKGN